MKTENKKYSLKPSAPLAAHEFSGIALYFLK